MPEPAQDNAPKISAPFTHGMMGPKEDAGAQKAILATVRKPEEEPQEEQEQGDWPALPNMSLGDTTIEDGETAFELKIVEDWTPTISFKEGQQKVSIDIPGKITIPPPDGLSISPVDFRYYFAPGVGVRAAIEVGGKLELSGGKLELERNTGLSRPDGGDQEIQVSASTAIEGEVSVAVKLMIVAGVPVVLEAYAGASAGIEAKAGLTLTGTGAIGLLSGEGAQRAQVTGGDLGLSLVGSASLEAVLKLFAGLTIVGKDNDLWELTIAQKELAKAEFGARYLASYDRGGGVSGKAEPALDSGEYTEISWALGDYLKARKLGKAKDAALTATHDLKALEDLDAMGDPGKGGNAVGPAQLARAQERRKQIVSDIRAGKKQLTTANGAIALIRAKREGKNSELKQKSEQLQTVLGELKQAETAFAGMKWTLFKNSAYKAAKKRVNEKKNEEKRLAKSIAALSVELKRLGGEEAEAIDAFLTDIEHMGMDGAPTLEERLEQAKESGESTHSKNFSLFESEAKALSAKKNKVRETKIEAEKAAKRRYEKLLSDFDANKDTVKAKHDSSVAAAESNMDAKLAQVEALTKQLAGIPSDDDNKKRRAKVQKKLDAATAAHDKAKGEFTRLARSNPVVMMQLRVDEAKARMDQATAEVKKATEDLQNSSQEVLELLALLNDRDEGEREGRKEIAKAASAP